jgi:two-component system, response regulator PdtaR
MTPNPEHQPVPAHVLVVQDDVLLRAHLADQLRTAGLTVVEAASADEAWFYLAAGGDAALVFCDIWTAGMLNGLELARRLKLEYPAISIILTSENPALHNVAGLGLCLAKPYKVDRAVSAVLETLRQRTPGDEQQ